MIHHKNADVVYGEKYVFTNTICKTTISSFKNYLYYTTILLLKVCKVNGIMHNNILNTLEKFRYFYRQTNSSPDMNQSSSITWISR